MILLICLSETTMGAAGEPPPPPPPMPADYKAPRPVAEESGAQAAVPKKSARVLSPKQIQDFENMKAALARKFIQPKDADSVEVDDEDWTNTEPVVSAPQPVAHHNVVPAKDITQPAIHHDIAQAEDDVLPPVAHHNVVSAEDIIQPAPTANPRRRIRISEEANRVREIPARLQFNFEQKSDLNEFLFYLHDMKKVLKRTYANFDEVINKIVVHLQSEAHGPRNYVYFESHDDSAKLEREVRAYFQR